MTLAVSDIFLATLADDGGVRVRPHPDADAADVIAVQSGDGEAFARIVRRHQPLLVRRMRRFSRDVGEIETLVHDAFVEAYLSLPRYRGDAPLEHWLQRIATRVGYRFWKRRARAVRPVDDSVAAPPVPDGAEAADERARVRAAVERLPPRDRLVITLLYVDGLSVADAAAMAGWTRTMTKVQAFRARAKLRRLLDDKGGGR